MLNLRRVLSYWLIPSILFLAGLGFFLLIPKEYGLGTIVTGFLWGLIYKSIPDTIVEKFTNNCIVIKFYRFFDPLRGNRQYESNGISYYNYQTQLPNFDSILEIRGLKQIDILSISSYLLLLNFNKQIEKSLIKGIRFNFLILNPKSQYVNIQSQNFSNIGKDLKYQLEKSIDFLRQINSNLDDNLKKNLSVHLYDKQIGKGIMIVHLEKDIWMKVHTYVIGSNPTERESQSTYEKDNKEFFDRYYNDFREILTKSSEKLL